MRAASISLHPQTHSSAGLINTDEGLSNLTPDQHILQTKLLLAEPNSFGRSSGVMATQFKIPETCTRPCPNVTSPHAFTRSRAYLHVCKHKEEQTEGLCNSSTSSCERPVLSNPCFTSLADELYFSSDYSLDAVPLWQPGQRWLPSNRRYL